MKCINFIRFVKSFEAFEWAKENMPETTISFYGDDEMSLNQNEKDKRALNFRGGIRNAIEKAKLFELDDEIKKLLCLTETPNKNDDIFLPFDFIFIDVNFTKEELKGFGIEIDAEELTGILVKEGVLTLNEKEIVGRDLNITMLSSQNNGEVWFDTFNKNCNVNEKYQKYRIKIIENKTTDKKARNFLHKFVLNFLNFLNNPEVEYIEHLRSEKNRERRVKQGKPIIPSSFTIRITGKLRGYIDEMGRGEHWNYNYRFWVRGHFRDLVGKRYKEKKRIWILPFIKGKGVLIEKSYELKNRNITRS